MSNVFSFTGTVARDCEQRYLPSGQAVLNFTCANNIGFGDKQQTLWIRVALWGKRAEGDIVNYLKKGKQVFVSGELTQREYKKDGVSKTSLELNANIIDLVGGRKDVDQSSNGQANSHQNSHQDMEQSTSGQGRKPEQQHRDNFSEAYDDDIPFASLNWQIRAHLI